MLTHYILIILIVGIVTAGLTIKFDRFFTILLLLFISGFTIRRAINIFLWVLMAGALMVILNNQQQLKALPKKKKARLFILIPIITAIASFIGSLLFIHVSSDVLLGTLGILAILYGLRLVFIHFEEHELKFEKGHPNITKICATFGPWVSGFLVGFIGTSLKSLKIPFAIKIGKMNLKSVYMGNVITGFFASLFAIIWHFLLNPDKDIAVFYQDMILGLALWTGIHYIYEIVDIIFPSKYRKGFQVFIGILLMLVSVKIFKLI